MKRVLSLSTTGLFLLGLAMVPLSARADQAAVDGKTAAPAAASATTSTPVAPTAMHGKTATTVGTQTPAAAGATATTPVKKDDHKMTVAPTGSAPAAASTVTKTPGKGAS